MYPPVTPMRQNMVLNWEIPWQRTQHQRQKRWKHSSKVKGVKTQLRLRLRLKTQFRQKVKAQLCCPSLATLILVSSWEHR